MILIKRLLQYWYYLCLYDDDDDDDDEDDIFIHIKYNRFFQMFSNIAHSNKQKVNLLYE